MFDAIIKEVASKFGLGDKAMPLIQMLLAYMSNSQTGGLSGFMDKFKNAGLGSLAQSWLGGGTNAQPISTQQVDSLFGGQGGLLGMITSKLGIGGEAASGALSFILPAIIGKLSSGGSMPTSLPSEALGLMGNAKDLLTGGAAAATGAASAAGGAALDVGKAAGGGLMKWLPWIVAAIAGLFLLNYCSKQGDVKPAIPAPPKVAAPAPKVDASAAPKVEAPAPAPVAATPAAPDAPKAPGSNIDLTVPTGAGVIASTVNGLPLLKVYFDTGKTDISTEFAEKSKAIIEFLKNDKAANAVINGYHDPSGNKAQNEELAKNRAKGVRDAIKAAGIDEARILMQKPAETSGAGGSMAEARRVEVSVQK